MFVRTCLISAQASMAGGVKKEEPADTLPDEVLGAFLSSQLGTMAAPVGVPVAVLSDDEVL